MNNLICIDVFRHVYVCAFIQVSVCACVWYMHVLMCALIEVGRKYLTLSITTHVSPMSVASEEGILRSILFQIMYWVVMNITVGRSCNLALSPVTLSPVWKTLVLRKW